jgi:alpha-1,3-mannosyltransferase
MRKPQPPPPPPPQQQKQPQQYAEHISKGSWIEQWKSWYVNSAMTQTHDWIYGGLLLVGEFLLGILIIHKVPYTEIDWIAYMQEVSIWYDQQEYNYYNIRGDTGPLVYPAGFLYLFWFIRCMTGVTSSSSSSHAFASSITIRKVQYIFLFFYLSTQGVVLSIYQSYLHHTLRRSMGSNTKVSQQLQQQQQQQAPPQPVMTLQHAHTIWTFRLLAMSSVCLSKRIHSIYLLRLFNDGPCMLLLYCSIWCFIHYRWNIGCVLFSCAVSIKMNVLLFAPGLLLLLLQVCPNVSSVIVTIAFYCGGPQLLLGLPFLLQYPIPYLRKAFELDRVFFYQWTVNWKFLPETLFLSKSWSLFLLLLHILTLSYTATRLLSSMYRQCGRRLFICHKVKIINIIHTNNNNNNKLESQVPSDIRLSPHYIVLTLFLSNFIGIVFARTLHYQFYVWYYHALPYFLWTTSSSSSNSSRSWSSFPWWVRLILLLAIESSFLTFPATAYSSMILQMSHCCILWSVIHQISYTELLLDGVSFSSTAATTTTKYVLQKKE